MKHLCKLSFIFLICFAIVPAIMILNHNAKISNNKPTANQVSIISPSYNTTISPTFIEDRFFTPAIYYSDIDEQKEIEYIENLNFDKIENEQLINRIFNFLTLIRNNEINELLPVDTYFNANDELDIKYIPTTSREVLNELLNNLENMIQTTPDIISTFENNSFNFNNEFLTNFDEFEEIICECLEY